MTKEEIWQCTVCLLLEDHEIRPKTFGVSVSGAMEKVDASFLFLVVGVIPGEILLVDGVDIDFFSCHYEDGHFHHCPSLRDERKSSWVVFMCV